MTGARRIIRPQQLLKGIAMVRKTLVLATLIAIAAAYSAEPARTQTRPSTSVVLYEGARLIAGDGSQAIASSAMLVENGTITRVGAKGSVNAPEICNGCARSTLAPTHFFSIGFRLCLNTVSSRLTFCPSFFAVPLNSIFCILA